jgi:Plavaka transposase
MLVPIILGSDKTTVSVATSHNEYHPLYLSIGSVHNNIHQAHCGTVVLIAFLAIPKSRYNVLRSRLTIDYHPTADKSHAKDVQFCKFQRQLFHSTLLKILQSLKPGMTTPEVVRCFDDHFRRAIYSLGTYIADYPEQALLTCIVQGWCPQYCIFCSSTRNTTYMFHRCTAGKKDLDGGSGWRSCEHTDLLVCKFELGVLWEEYGLVGDVVVGWNISLMFIC